MRRDCERDGVAGRLCYGGETKAYHPIIDADFEVIDSGRRDEPESPEIASGRWSFLHDDLPNLIGLAAGFATMIALALLFHHG